jgi:hypothetical protein
MARGKHATALFEVIHTAKLKDRTTEKSGAFKTPKWWFKGRDKSAPAAPAAAPAPAPAAPVRSTPQPAARASVTYAPRSAQSAPAPVLSNDPTAPPQIVIYDDEPEHCADPTSSPTPSDADPTERAAAVFGHRMTGGGREAQAFRSAHSTDEPRDGRQLTFRLTYTTMGLGAGAIAVVLAVVYLVGSHMSRGPSSAMGGSIEQLRSGKPAPAVLRVGTNGERITANDETTLQIHNPAGASPAPRPTPTNDTPGGAGSVGGPQNTPPAVTNGKRVVGMQYVVMQTYPEEADAKACVEFLTKAGIGATAEKGFWPSRPSWFTVVGTKEFDRTKNNAEFDRYLVSLTTAGNKFAGNSKFKKFEPMVVKWKDR